MTRIAIRIIPNASKTEIVGGWSRRPGQGLGVGMLTTLSAKIRVAAPPVDGKANEELVKFLSKEFGCAPSDIRIKKGFASKTKIVEIP